MNVRSVAPLENEEDSNLNPDYVNFTKTKEPKKETQKNNQEGLIPEED